MKMIFGICCTFSSQGIAAGDSNVWRGTGKCINKRQKEVVYYNMPIVSHATAKPYFDYNYLGF